MITLRQLVYDCGLEKGTKVMIKNSYGFVLDDTLSHYISDGLFDYQVYDLRIRDNTLIIKLDTTVKKEELGE